MKTHRFSLPSLALLSAILPLNSHAADKHVHGMAELFIAIEGKQVLIELESPAANIVGFEHAPRTDEQQAAINAGMSALKNATNILQLSDGECKQTDVFVKSPFSDSKHMNEEGHHEREEHDHHEEHDHEEEHDHHEEHDHDYATDTHSEFHVTYTLACENSDAIKSATITAFSNFYSIQKVLVNWVTSQEQGSKTVSAKDNQVKLK